MNLARHAAVLWRFRAVTAGGLLLGIVLAVLASYKISPTGLKPRGTSTYSSQSQLLVTQPGFPEGRVVLPARRRSDRRRDGEQPTSTPTGSSSPTRAASWRWRTSTRKLIVSDEVRAPDPRAARRRRRSSRSPLPAVSGAPILPIIQLDDDRADRRRRPHALNAHTVKALREPAQGAPGRATTSRRRSASRSTTLNAPSPGALTRRALAHRLDPGAAAVPDRHDRGHAPARDARATAARRDELDDVDVDWSLDADVDEDAGRRPKRRGRAAMSAAAAARRPSERRRRRVGRRARGAAGRGGRARARAVDRPRRSRCSLSLAAGRAGRAGEPRCSALVVAGLVLVAYQRVLLAWQTMLGLILVVILFIPIRRYTVGGNLPIELEPYRIVIARRARVLVLRARRRPARALAPHRARGADRRAPRWRCCCRWRRNIARVNAAGPIGHQELHVLPQLPAARLLHRQRRPRAARPGPDARAARRRAARSSPLAALVEWRTSTNLFNWYSHVMPFLHYVDEGVAQARGSGVRARGSAQHPIALSAALVMLVPLALYLYQRHRTLHLARLRRPAHARRAVDRARARARRC